MSDKTNEEETDWKPEETYLYDGVYAAYFNTAIRLRAEQEGGVMHEIYIDPGVWAKLKDYAKKVGMD